MRTLSEGKECARVYIAGFELPCLDALSVERQRNVYLALVYCLAQINLEYRRQNPGTPRLYSFRPKYIVKQRPMGVDEFSDLPTLIKYRSGDCKDFVAARLSELWQDGILQATPFITMKRIGNIDCWHVVISVGPNIEDPSANLGMPENLSYAELSAAFQ